MTSEEILAQFGPRAATDDDHVVLHGLAGAELGQDF